MKKSLIALAALATVGAAQAQSSVTVYGILDAGYSDISREVTTRTLGTEKESQKAFAFNNYTSSRLGFRGTEDLGGGLRANFVIESGISSNVQAGFSQASVNRFSVAAGDRGNGATTAGTTIDGTSLGNRELNASITNTKSGTTIGAGFGSTAIRNIWAAFDPAGGTNLVGNILTNDAQFSSNRATGFGVAQKLGDFTVGAAMSQNNKDYTSSSSTTGLNNEKSSTGYTFNLGYAKGPAAFAAATQEVKVKTNAVTGTTSLTTNSATNSAICTLGGGTFTAIGSTSAVSGNGDATNIASCALANTAATDIKRTTNIVAGSYDFGVAKVFANYGSVKTDDAQSANAAGEGKRSAYVLGAQVPVGKATLFALYSDGTQTQATTAGTGAVKRDITGYTVGGRYAFSKRTFAYAAAGETKLDVDTNSANGDRNFGIKVKQATAGLVHSF